MAAPCLSNHITADCQLFMFQVNLIIRPLFFPPYALREIERAGERAQAKTCSPARSISLKA